MIHIGLGGVQKSPSTWSTWWKLGQCCFTRNKRIYAHSFLHVTVLCSKLFLKNCTKRPLIYNLVLISAPQQSDSVTNARVLSCVWLFTIPWTTRLLCPWNFLGKNTGVGCHILLQGISPGIKHITFISRQILDHLATWGSSVIHTYVLFRILFHMIYHRTLNILIVPCVLP